MKQNKVLSLIGLATKAGKVASGEFSVEKAVKSGRAYLVLIALDASENSKKMYRNMCNYRKVPMVCYSNKEELGRSMGKGTRVSVAILDQGFAKEISRQIEALKTE